MQLVFVIDTINYYNPILFFGEHLDEYQKEYSRRPRIASPLAYDALKIITLAIKSGGYNSEGIKNALYQIKNYSGATGLTSFNEKGDAYKEVIIKTVKNGKFVIAQ